MQHLAIANVICKRRLGADRLRLSIRHDGAVIQSVGKPPQVSANLAEMIDQHSLLSSGQVADRADAQRVQSLLALGADAPKSAHGQWREEPRYLMRSQHDQSIGLPDVAREFREKLVRRYTDRNVQVGLGLDAILELPGDLRRRAEKSFAT